MHVNGLMTSPFFFFPLFFFLRGCVQSHCRGLCYVWSDHFLSGGIYFLFFPEEETKVGCEHFHQAFAFNAPVGWKYFSISLQRRNQFIWFLNMKLPPSFLSLSPSCFWNRPQNPGGRGPSLTGDIFCFKSFVTLLLMCRLLLWIPPPNPNDALLYCLTLHLKSAVQRCKTPCGEAPNNSCGLFVLRIYNKTKTIIATKKKS